MYKRQIQFGSRLVDRRQGSQLLLDARFRQSELGAAPIERFLQGKLEGRHLVFLAGRFCAGAVWSRCAATCSSPVSYTHLDVYKRQQMYLAGGTSGHRRGAMALRWRSSTASISRFHSSELSLIHI